MFVFLFKLNQVFIPIRAPLEVIYSLEKSDVIELGQECIFSVNYQKWYVISVIETAWLSWIQSNWVASYYRFHSQDIKSVFKIKSSYDLFRLADFH